MTVPFLRENGFPLERSMMRKTLPYYGVIIILGMFPYISFGKHNLYLANPTNIRNIYNSNSYSPILQFHSPIKRYRGYFFGSKNNVAISYSYSCWCILISYTNLGQCHLRLLRLLWPSGLYQSASCDIFAQDNVKTHTIGAKIVSETILTYQQYYIEHHWTKTLYSNPDVFHCESVLEIIVCWPPFWSMGNWNKLIAIKMLFKYI